MANFTQKAIVQTFNDMLVEMPFDKITVSALVARCGISSNTFYYHFRDIYDLLDVWLELIKEKYLNNALLEKDRERAYIKLLYVLKDNITLVHHVFDSLSRERIEKYVFDNTEKWFYAQLSEKTAAMNIDESMLRDISSYYCYSIIGFILKFIWKCDDIDIEKEVDLMIKIFDGYFDYLVSNGGNIPKNVD